MKKIIFFTILLCLLLAFSACSGDVNQAPPPAAESTIETPTPEPTRTAEPAVAPETNIATRDDVLFALTHPDQWQIIDVRTYEEWSGATMSQSGGASGTGRIAGALHLDWFSLRDMPQDELLAYLDSVLDGRNIIIYCHSGARSTQAMAVFEQLDVTVLNYQGSWLDWSQAITENQESDNTFLDFTEAWTDLMS